MNLILGIDGLEPEFVEYMDFVESLKEDSLYGWHECFKCGQDVPHTGPNWMTLYTAKPPEEHGVTFGGWTHGETDIRDFHTIFDEINCGVIDMPITWKAKEIDGWMFSGFPSAKKSCYPEAKKEYFGWGLPGKLVVDLNEGNISKEVFKSEYMDNEETKYWHFRKLYQNHPVDNVFYGISMLDHFGHFLSKEEVKEGYRWIDDKVKEIYEFLQPDNLIIISDHGFNFKTKQHDDYGFHLHYPHEKEYERNDILDLAEYMHNLLK